MQRALLYYLMLFPPQAEIILTFFIGFHRNGLYIDSVSVISRRYVSSLSLFWFDVATSIPLSYVDIYYSKVLAAADPLPVPVVDFPSVSLNYRTEAI